MRTRLTTSAPLALIVAFATGLTAQAEVPEVQREAPRRFTMPPFDPDRADIEQITLRVKAVEGRPDEAPLIKKEIQAIRRAAGIGISYSGGIGGRMHSFNLPRRMSYREAERICERIRTLPEIEFATPSTWLGLQATPNDTHFNLQWNLKEDAGAIRATKAWDLITGNPNIVIAAVDGGILALHEDIVGRLVSSSPAGYDFVSNSTFANDGNGRDNDPSDPGNWITAAEAATATFSGCEVTASSWHGTAVAGIAAAATNTTPAKGVAGINWTSRILPVRVFGKCSSKSGNINDIIAAIQWSAGHAVDSVPNNPTPAHVINMSFGGPRATCDPTLQAALDASYKRRAVLVAGAGNTAQDVAGFQPANCKKVITVAAVTRRGGLASYSNRGAKVTISAPGGGSETANEVGDPLGLPISDLVLYPANTGTTVPVADTYRAGSGTSYAAPHVSGVVSLMLSVQPKLRLENVKAILQNTARPFPTGTARDCTIAECGAGILDAEQAVKIAKSAESGGTYHSAAVKSDGRVTTWGFNGNGQLGGGEGLGIVRASPGVPIAGLLDVREVAAGGFHTVAAKRDGTVFTWGFNANGQLGDNTQIQRTTAVQVAGLTNVLAVAAGDRHSLALKSDGTVVAWGYNFFGQLGPGPFDFTDRVTPVAVFGLTDVVAIAAAGKRSLALKRDGTVWQWGDVASVSPNGTIGTISSVPVQVAGLADVMTIAAGGVADTGVNVDASMALGWDGRIYAWGYNDFGQLGIGSFSTKFLPQWVSSIGVPAISIATGGYHSLALLEDGTLRSWGNNCGGQLGNGSQGTSDCIPPVFSTTPVQVQGGLSKVVDIGAGRNHTFSFHGDSTLRMWGSNLGGQLGDSTQTNRPLPTQVRGQGGSGLYYAAFASSASSDLSVSLSDTPDPIPQNGDLAYNVLVSNNGPATATNITTVVTVASTTQVVSAGSGCSITGATVTCLIASLASPGASAFQVIVIPSTPGVIDASVSANSDLFDPSPNNNVAGATTVVSSAPAGNNADVPTLPQWAMIAMASLLMLSAAGVQRRSRIKRR
ncbi:MAG: S8 family serine peptidase [Burkholderiales bacterium]